MTDKEWQTWYLAVTFDPRFKLFGLTKDDILDLVFYIDVMRKTPSELRKQATNDGF